MPHAKRMAGLVIGMSIVGSLGCKDLTGAPALPPGVTDPAVYRTAAGAAQQVDGTRGVFREALNRFIMQGGMLSDELTVPFNPLLIGSGDVVDSRRLPDNITDQGDPTNAYAQIQNARVQADLGIQAIRAYGSSLAPALRGELFVLQGYSEIMLGDLFCSGVPLSTLALRGNLQYEPGVTRDSLYRHAKLLFDSATVLVDSGPLLTAARIGQGRTLLALGDYQGASSTVAPVQTTDQYTLNVVLGNIINLNGSTNILLEFGASVSDYEGGTGPGYRSSGDPRTPVLQLVNGGESLYEPTKYLQPASDSSPVVIASGVEARLIEAEAALAAGNASWLTILNTLRTDGSNFTVGGDTMWNAGTGGVSGLRPLADPGTPAARVDTLFAERSAWLFVDGHRQGDLRRLIRQYHRAANQVYPTGLYPPGGVYGGSLNAAIPYQERRNPLFHGCIDRNA